MMPTALLSALFVLIWSSGFIVGRLIVGSVSPNIFLGIRFALSAAMFALLVHGLHRPYPPLRDWGKHFFIGFLNNGLYLGGGYWAVSQQMPAALMALFGGLQPLFTLMITVAVFRERLDYRTLAGIAVGLFGLYLAVSPALGNSGETPFAALAVALLAVFSITIGMLLQKHWLNGHLEIMPSLVLQNIAGTLTAVCLAVLLGENLLTVNGSFMLGVLWAVAGLSGLGIYLFILLMKHGKAVQTAALVLLAPPLAAWQARILFGDTLSGIQIGGFALALAGVWLCQDRGRLKKT